VQEEELSIVVDRPLEANVEALIAEAQRRTGLTDFGPNRFDEAIGVQIAAANNEANLTAEALERHLQGCVRDLALCLQMQDFFVRHPEIEDQPVVAPVVIIGLQRTGTSKLFRNIAADPQWNVLYTWQGLNPIPPAGWVPGQPDPRLAEAEVWCEQQRHLARAHLFEARAPEMEALLMAQTHMLNGGPLLVPSHQKWLETADFLPVYRHLKRQLQFLQWQNRAPAGRRWILKSPPHLMSLDALLAVFPDAKLVMTHRHPKSSVGSMFKLVELTQAPLAKSIDYPRIRDIWLRIMSVSIERFMQLRERVGSESILDVRFRDLVGDPLPAIRRIYEFAGAPYTAETEAAAAAWHDGNPQHSEGKFEYNLADYSATEADIDRAFARYLREFSQFF
jgi:hypothetical protein